MTIKETSAMIADMRPGLCPGRWVFCTTTDLRIVSAAMQDAMALVREAEGITLILPLDRAAALGFDIGLAMARITLSVFSDLEGVGLTAAVAQALTNVGVSCNVVAGFHHDHLFVPEKDAERAMAALIATQRLAAG
jgi:hypothetical protein